MAGATGSHVLRLAGTVMRVSRSRSPRDRVHRRPDPGHACADPVRCTRPFCAVPVDIHLVSPDQTRVVVRDLPGWPQSASALFHGLNEQIGREHLLWIAAADPFGARLHFPIMVRIRLSARVPPKLEFNPGEALHLTRWSRGPEVDHLARAWCCTLMVISPDYGVEDDLADVAAQLVDSCLTLGGDLPELAEQLLAWRAVSEAAEHARRCAEQGYADHGYPDPVALLALLLLRAATAPTDPRIGDLARTVADAFAAPHELPWPWSDDLPRLTDAVSMPLWRHLIDTVLTPLRPTQPDLDRLIRTTL